MRSDTFNRQAGVAQASKYAEHSKEILEFSAINDFRHLGKPNNDNYSIYDKKLG